MNEIVTQRETMERKHREELDALLTSKQDIEKKLHELKGIYKSEAKANAEV